MKAKKNKVNKKSVFEPFTLVNTRKKEPETNVNIPGNLDVSEAKDWVDSNEK